MRAKVVSSETHELYQAKLASSGLGLDDAEALGLAELDQADTAKLGFTEARPALLIPYFGLDGKPLADWPKAPQFFRVRYLDKGNSFSAQQTKESKVRYKQPPNTVPCAYLPKTIDWLAVAPDVEQSVLITEGELKAASAAKLGFPTIGLGGVWSFRSKEMGISFLSQLSDIEWCRRKAYLVFDSDLATNQHVAAALEELAYELQQRGAYVMIVWLPQVLGEGEKVGLDDFIVFHGDKAEAELTELLCQSDPLGFTEALFDLNKRYLYVANPGILLDQRTMSKHRPAALKEHLAAPTTVLVKTIGANGEPQYKKASAGSEWLKWPLRASVDKLVYAPGQDRLTTEGSLQCFNEWPGWGCQPAKGDVSPFLKLVDHLFKGADPEAKRWFLRWLAWPLRYPGTKLFTSAVIFGIKHGTGKSLVGYTMGKIYGENFTEIKQDNLHGDFNEWAMNKQFVLGDDVTGSNKRQDNDVLKKMITQEKVRINPKYVPSYELRDCINYLFTSNQPDAFFLEDDDRRFFIHEVVVKPLDEIFYVDYVMWLGSGGAEAVFDYLLHLDLGSFNPAAPAFKTNAKNRMIADVRSDLGAWCRLLIENPDQVLRVGDVVSTCDLFTNKELLLFYDHTGRTGTTANGLGRELRRAGVVMANGGMPVRWTGGFDRFYAVRNQDKWAESDHKVVKDYLDKQAESIKRTKAKY